MKALLEKCLALALHVLRECDDDDDKEELCDEASEVISELEQVLEPPDRN